MSIKEDFKIIKEYAHVYNWLHDWDVAVSVYDQFPDSYSVLTPFAYAYLEEMIRSTTSEYGIEILDNNGQTKYRRVGSKLVNLAMTENSNNAKYCKLLKHVKMYFSSSKCTDKGNNRNSVAHGYMHPLFWTQESFEELVHLIADLSPYSQF